MGILIRTELEEDYHRVEEITRIAFSYPGRIEQGGIGCPYEHWMVHELRKRDGICKAKTLGFGAILFFGRPEYYPQFGFKEASLWGITDLNGQNYPAFMGMELIPGYLACANGGKYYESSIYDDDLNREKVKAFDDLYFA